MRSPLRMLLALLAIGAMPAVPASASGEPFEHTPVPTATGGNAGAATGNSVATDAAIEVLRKGGNAVDATVAAAAVLGVVDPYSAGIGGGGFMVIRTPRGRVATIDSRELSPEAMRPDSFIEDGVPLAFDDAQRSGLSVGVPGTVAGWNRALRRYGRYSLRRLLQPAIRVARAGFVVDPGLATLSAVALDYLNDITSTRAVYLESDGTPYEVGDVLRNPDLARTYERIADLGPRGFYRGPVAEAIVQAVRRPPVAADANHVWRPGLMTEKDVRRYEALEREPTHVRYRGLDVWGMAPPSSGGSTVGEMLNVLEGYRDLGRDRVLTYHRYLEASRLAFADRGAFLGDPAFTDVPLCGLLTQSFADERRALISDARAMNHPAGAGEPRDNCAGGRAGRATTHTEHRHGRETTHLTVADARGTVVSYTFTIEGLAGSGIVVPGWGFLLNNELTDFDYYATEGPNRADGRKRPRSSMSPTIVTWHGRPFLALGSPGGSTIITTVVRVLLERLDFGQSLPAAIAASRASQRNAPATEAEQAFRDTYEAALAARGHVLEPAFEPPGIGAVTAIEFLRCGNLLSAAEPTRRGGGNAQVTNLRRRTCHRP